MTHQSVKRRQVLFSDLPARVDFNAHEAEDWQAWEYPQVDKDVLSDRTPLKQLPICMQEKRHLRQKRRWEQRTVRCCESWAQNQQRSCRRALEVLQDLTSACQLWKKPLCEIEGRFGSGIHSYFTFLRFLVFLNLVSFALTSACILVPIIFFSQPLGATAGVPLPGPDPQCVNASLEGPWKNTSIHTYFLDIFTGGGFLKTSYLFYGKYRQGETSGSSFSIRLAYLLSILAYLLFCFIWVTRKMVKEMIQKRMHSRDYRTRLSTKIFTGWDYCISSVEAGLLKQHSISNDLKMDLGEEIRYLAKREMTLLEKARLVLIRVLVNTVIMLMMAGTFYCIYLATGVSQEYEQSSDPDETFSWSVVTEYLPPIVIALANFLLPLVFRVLVQFESYSPNAEANLTLMRSLLLKLASLGMFLFSLGKKVLCMGHRGDPACSACGYNHQYQCWETSFGQEMYKMTIFNFLAILLVTLLVRLPWRLIVDSTSWKLAQWIGKEEFLVPSNILDIVDAQTIVWIGLFYSPLLPLINCIFLFITFYIKKYILCNLCKPSKKLLRASSSKFFFQFVLLLGLSLASIPLLYTIFNSRPSRGCGLFARHETAWHVVMEAVATSLSPAAQTIVIYAGSDAFAFPLIFILCLVLTMYISKDRSNRQSIEQLKAHLVMQAKDKRYLVEELSLLLKESPPTL